jgi:hypothetical protein
VDVENQRRLLAWDPTKNTKVSSIVMDKGNYHRIFQSLPKFQKQVICSELVQAWKGTLACWPKHTVSLQSWSDAPDYNICIVLTGGSCKASHAFPLRTAPYTGDFASKYSKDILTTNPYILSSAETSFTAEPCIMPQNHDYFYPSPEFPPSYPQHNFFHSSPAQLLGQSAGLTADSYASDYYHSAQYRSPPKSFYDPVEEVQTLVGQPHPTASGRQSKRRKFRRPAATRIATSSCPQSFTMNNGQDKDKSCEMTRNNNNINITTTTVKPEVKQSKLNPAVAAFLPIAQQQQQHQPATEAPPVTNAILGPGAPAMIPARSGPVVVIGTTQNGEWSR